MILAGNSMTELEKRLQSAFDSYSGTTRKGWTGGERLRGMADDVWS